MRVIIAGSRTIIDLAIVERAIENSDFNVTEVVSGGARGVDALGEAWARKNGIPVKLFPADWKKHGRSAGMIRNAEMAEYAYGLIAIWDGKSRGTLHMISCANKRGNDVHIHRTDR